jgi:hypothetical protein
MRPVEEFVELAVNIREVLPYFEAPTHPIAREILVFTTIFTL